MEEKKTNWAEALAKAVGTEEMKNVHLGIEIVELQNAYYYEDLIAFLKGDTEGAKDIYFGKLKPLYDKYGYEKVNRILLALEDEKGGKADE